MKKFLLTLFLPLIFLNSHLAQADIQLDNPKIDYQNIKLMIPEDSKGQNKGDAIEIKKVPGYSHPSYFYVDNLAQIFSVPTTGATSSGSHYPRTEAQELKDGDRFTFPASTGGTITSTLAVLELPQTSKGKPCVVFDQFHGKTNEVLRETYCASGEVSYKNDKPKEHEVFLRNAAGQKLIVPLGEYFDNRAELKGKTLTVTAIYKGVEYKAVETIDKYFQKDVFFAKFGAYCQVSGLDKSAGNYGTGKCKVAFRSASITH